MKIYIFDYIQKCSDNYHTGGGLVIIAESVEHAKELISKDSSIKITTEEWGEVEVFNLARKKVEAKYWVMPDAGCC